ncbi:MAG: ribonuclease HII [Gemmatimonadales bacterium]
MASGPRPGLDQERQAWAEARLLIGVDEAGRGPLAGPVVAAAVMFPFACGERPGTAVNPGRRGRMPVAGLRDSKTLPQHDREKLFPMILATAIRVAVGAASVREIDRINIRRASALAMRRAVQRLLAAPAPVNRQPSTVNLNTCTILIDGLPLPELGFPHQALVDGDAKCCSIAAAGIVAKVVRDRLMARLAARHQGYGWATNVGYHTDEHLVGIARLGATRHHRLTFAPLAQHDLFAGLDTEDSPVV